MIDSQNKVVTEEFIHYDSIYIAFRNRPNNKYIRVHKQTLKL